MNILKHLLTGYKPFVNDKIEIQTQERMKFS